jgi:hypothetical protein
MNKAELFFEQNKNTFDRKHVLFKLPRKDMTDEEIALWILKGHHGDWLNLNLNINKKEFLLDEKHAESLYVPHRDIKTGEGTHLNWMSCTLHGIAVDKTNVWSTYGYTEKPKYEWTSLGKKTTKIREFCESLPFEKLDRVRFMKLGPKGYITPHTDGGSGINWNEIWNHPLPINIAIYHPLGCYTSIEGTGAVPFSDGKAFLINILKTHSVTNFTSQERKHLIVHGIVGNCKEEYCKLLADNYRKAYALQSKAYELQDLRLHRQRHFGI